MKESSLTKAIDAYLEKYDIIIISGEINRKCFQLTKSILSNTQNKKAACALYLSTFGGDPNSGYRITRLLQELYSTVRFVIPYMCKSTGTLMAIGANEIAMNNLSEFGPLDIQVQRKDEFSEHTSTLDLVQSIKFIEEQTRESFTNNLVNMRLGARISTKMCAEFAVKLATSIAEPLYSQIDPQRLGELQRAMNITKQYGMRLSEKSQSITEENLNKLVTSYPTHGFVIDKSEASDIFTNVCELQEIEQWLCDRLSDYFYNPNNSMVTKIDRDTLISFVPNEQSKSGEQNGSSQADSNSTHANSVQVPDCTESSAAEQCDGISQVIKKSSRKRTAKKTII